MKSCVRNYVINKLNTDDVIHIVTIAAFSISHPDCDYETELRLGILCALRGVGEPVASAIPALGFPERYAAIDFKVWRQIIEKTTFPASDYKRYLHEIQRLALELNWTVQEVYLIIWEYDRINGVNPAISKTVS